MRLMSASDNLAEHKFSNSSISPLTYNKSTIAQSYSKLVHKAINHLQGFNPRQALLLQRDFVVWYRIMRPVCLESKEKMQVGAVV